MTRLKFDVSGVDPGGDFKVPKPGAYPCKIDVIEPKQSQAGNDMLEVQYVITEDGEFQDARLWDYIVLNDSSAWKYRRFLEAVGAVSGKKEKGEINLEKLIGKRVLVKVTNEDSDEWGKRARVGSVSKLSKADLDDEEPEDEDEDVEEDDEEEELTRDDVMSMKKVELKELIDEQELGLRVTKQTKLNTLRERVAEALGLEDEEEEEDEDIEEEDVEEEEADEEEAEEEEDDDEVEEVEDYAELSVGDLKAECKERGLSVKGTKAALVKRLEKDDDEADAL